MVDFSILNDPFVVGWWLPSFSLDPDVVVANDEPLMVDSIGNDESGGGGVGGAGGWLIIRLIGCCLCLSFAKGEELTAFTSSSKDVKPQLLIRFKAVTAAGRRRLIVFLIDAGDTSSSISAIPQLLSRWLEKCNACGLVDKRGGLDVLVDDDDAAGNDCILAGGATTSVLISRG